MTAEEWTTQLRAEGFKDVAVHSFPPNTEFGVHTHPEQSVHVMLDGELTLTDNEEVIVLQKGDRIDIPAGTAHDARGGPKGFSFLVGVK